MNAKKNKEIMSINDDISSEKNIDEEELASQILAEDSRSQLFIPAFHTVGVGASAGGLEALELFFSNLNANTGMAYVVIQHLSPDYKSLMVELLSKHTQMEVLRAEDGMKVEQNKVYLIPPKKNMTIFHGRLLLTDHKHNVGLNLPIDIFLRSLAEDFNEKAIGVILSGTGSDGTLGIRAIKGAGGMVMCQEESSAKFDGMPKSAISTGLVDYIMPPQFMGEQLLKYSKHPYIVKGDMLKDKLSDNDDTLSKILALIRSQTGNDFTYYKSNTIVRRIERRISINQIDNIDNYLLFLLQAPNEIKTLYKELLIGVTKFFRDTEAFKELKQNIIPKIFEDNNSIEPLRIWVAGCSTGEEAYSIAILFREYLDEKNISRDIKIFATDIDKESIEYASAGVYTDSIVADVSEERLKNYFIKQSNSFRVNELIRQMVIFATHNLIKDPPFSKIDLVSCRNMLIYLEPIMQKKVISAFSFSLNKNAFLFLGSSESLGDLSNYFFTFNSKWKIFRSNHETKHHIVGELYMPTIKKDKNISFYTEKKPKLITDDMLLEKIRTHLLYTYIPPAIVIDSKFNIVHVFNEVNEFLKVPSGKMNLNILNMVPPELYIAIGTAVHRVLKEKTQLTYNELSYTIKDDVRFINLTVKPFHNKDEHSELILLVFENISATVTENKEVGENYEVDANAKQRIDDLQLELKYTKENLQATIEELETSNEELQATNEELIASNEELQSTNEELQSVNEELYTVNSEYQNKIEELTELNNDINNWFSTTSIGTVFLDLKLKIRKFTPAIDKFVNIINSDINRPFKHISYNFTSDKFFEDIEGVLKTLQSVEREFKTKDDNWVLLKIHPYRTIENAVKGIVITFIDITQRKRYQDQLQLERDMLHTVLENSPIAKLMINRQGYFYFANQKSQALLGFTEEEITQMSFFDPRLKFTDDKHNTILRQDFPFSKVLNKKEFLKNEKYHYEKPNGTVIHVEITAYPLFDEKDMVLGGVFMLAEINGANERN